MPISRIFSAFLVPLSLALTLTYPANAQAPEAVEQSQQATPAMWRVADKDSEFILLGSFHILPPELDWRTPALANAMEGAQTVYFEVDAESTQAQTKTVGVVMTQGFLPSGQKLTNLLERNDADKFVQIARSLNLPLAGVDPMRPWNAFLTLSVQFIIQQGFDPSAGVDSSLISEAKVRGKDLVYFETIEEQLGFFTGLSPEVEKDLLVLTIREWENQLGAFDKLYTAWTTGDTSVIDAEMNLAMREQAPEVFTKLITERNARWADQLESDLRNGAGKALIVVGAGHLVGDQYSVPALLAARGFDVSRYGESAPEVTPITPSTPQESAPEPVSEPVDANPVEAPANDNSLPSPQDAIRDPVEPVLDEGLTEAITAPAEEITNEIIEIAQPVAEEIATPALITNEELATPPTLEAVPARNLEQEPDALPAGDDPIADILGTIIEGAEEGAANTAPTSILPDAEDISEAVTPDEN